MTRVILLVALLSCQPQREEEADVVVDEDADASLARAFSRIEDIDTGLPRVEDGYVWWADRHDDGTTEHLRRKTEPGAPVELVLDEKKEMAAAFVDVGTLSASPDRQKVAFSADVTRTDRYGVHVKDLNSGLIHRYAYDADFSVAWSMDGSLYFTRFGADDRPRSLWRVQPEVDETPTLVHELAASEPGELLVADVDGEPELFVRPDAETRAPVLAYPLSAREGGGDLHGDNPRWRRSSIR